MATPKEVMKMIADNEVKFVDLRFTDTKGKEQHVSVPAKMFDNDKFEHGHAFDGSSIAGWKGIEASDMLLMPDAASARMDPFREENTLILSCDVIEPSTGKGYDRDPPGRHRLLRSGARVLHLRLGDLERRYVRLLRQDQVRGSAVVHRHRLRGR
jgi:glutamine synthetase